MGKLAHEFKLDGADLRLLHALQEEPRAAWSAIAPIVRVDASGLSRRWQKMKESGIAWVTGLAETTVPGSVALVDIDCEAGAMEEVARSLERDSEIVTLDCTTGSRDLLATVLPPLKGKCRGISSIASMGLWEFVQPARTLLLASSLMRGGGAFKN